MTEPKAIVAVYDTKPYDKEYLSQAARHLPVHFRYHDFRLEPETAAAAAGAVAACIFVNDNGSRPSLEGLAKAGIRHLALRCAGFNNVDLAAARELGLKVTRVPSYSPHAVAEHAVALLLALNRKIPRASNRVRDFNFSLSGLVGFDLYGKTVGVVGTGKTGRLVAEILRGFKMRVLAYDVYPDEAWAAAHQIDYVPLPDIFKESDVITLHTPLTPETDRIVNAESLALMKRGVYLINVSRGRLIHTHALLQALKSGHVEGVGLDVYEEEEGVFFEDLSGAVLLDDELARLLTFPNVLVTAHQAFLTHEALTEIARITVENVRLHLENLPPIEGSHL